MQRQMLKGMKHIELENIEEKDATIVRLSDVNVKDEPVEEKRKTC